VLRRLMISFQGRYSRDGNPSPISHDSIDSEHAIYYKPIKSEPITKADKKFIMTHIDELFVKDRVQSNKSPAKTGIITKTDKKLIMAYIDKLFVKDGEQTEEKYA